MASRRNSSDSRSFLTAARAALKDKIVMDLAGEVEGRVVEILPVGHGGASACLWPSIVSYADGEVPQPVAWRPGVVTGAGLVLWLFGPERIAEPHRIYHRLARELGAGAAVVIASEAPWAGKQLSEGEFGEYTSEETTASLVLTGAEKIVQLVEGPIFKLWLARVGCGKAHRSLVDAAEHLERGDWLGAENALATMEKPLTSLLAVREYALLTAGCLDLGDDRAACLGALSEALHIDPYCARAMCGIGRIAALGGDLSIALDFFKLALEREPALVAALHGKAVVLEALGDLPEALKAVRIAAALRPSSAAIRAKEGELARAVGGEKGGAAFVPGGQVIETPQAQLT
jgi:hypothetical protein